MCIRDRVYGTPNEVKLHKIEIYTKSPTAIPKNPNIKPSKINTNLKHLR